MAGREFGLARNDRVEAQARSGLDPGTGGQAGVGEGQLAVQTADRREDHPTLGLATLATALVHLRHLKCKHDRNNVNTKQLNNMIAMR